MHHIGLNKHGNSQPYFSRLRGNHMCHRKPAITEHQRKYEPPCGRDEALRAWNSESEASRRRADTLWEWHLTDGVLSSGESGLGNMWPESFPSALSACRLTALCISKHARILSGVKTTGRDRAGFIMMTCLKPKTNKSTGNEWNVSLKQDVHFSFIQN